MKKKDLLIVAHLRRNSRATLTDISRKSGIPISTIYEKIKKNEDGIIVKNTCLIDFTKLGFHTRAKIALQANLASRQELLNYLLGHPHINTVYRINNGFDYLLEGVFRHIRDLEEFLELLQVRFKVRKIENFHVIADLKREEFLSDASTIDLVWPAPGTAS